MPKLLTTGLLLCVVALAGCSQSPEQPTNEQLGFNNICLGVDGKWHPGDPFAPVVNNSGCLRFGIQPMFPN